MALGSELGQGLDTPLEAQADLTGALEEKAAVPITSVQPTTAYTLRDCLVAVVGLIDLFPRDTEAGPYTWRRPIRLK